MPSKMDEAISQIKNAIVSGRTDIVNALLKQCSQCKSSSIPWFKYFCREFILFYQFIVGHVPSQFLKEIVLPEGTFLHLATSLGHQDIVRALLNAGADPSVENKQDETAYELALSEPMQNVFVAELLRATAKSEYVPSLGYLTRSYKL